jgi:hypothetical protein
VKCTIFLVLELPRDRGDAQGDPRRRGHRGGTAESCPNDREVARLANAAELVATAVEETLAYYDLAAHPNPLERILRDIRRRTRVVGSFRDGQSALNLATTRLRHIAGTAWSTNAI